LRIGKGIKVMYHNMENSSVSVQKPEDRYRRGLPGFLPKSTAATTITTALSSSDAAATLF
jgi:hypothetical protein